MTDQRPQYGELATPEEQRRAAGLPPVAEPSPAAGQPPIASSAPAETAPARSHPVDRFVTIGLLAYGLVNVVVSGLSYLDPTRVMSETLAALGVDGEFTNIAQGRLWGTIAAVVLFAGWAITAALSIRRLRRGKLTWWVPLVGAVATIGLASICIVVPMLGDPAFVEYMNSIAGG
jgi:uncharacterized membrane protein YhaH (DUF805 family)